MTSRQNKNDRKIDNVDNNNDDEVVYHTPNGKGGRYLFGDYTPFDENKNFIHMLKDFVSISSNIIQIHQNAEKLRFVLKDAELFQNEMITKVDQFKRSTEESLDTFHRKYNEEIVNSMFPTSTSTEDPFFQIKKALIHPLIDREREYIGYFEEYKKYIQSRIIDSYKNAVTLLQTLLSKDHYSLPYALIANTSSVIEISIDKKDDRSYRISRVSTIAQPMFKPGSSYHNMDITRTVDSSSLSYSSIIDRSYLEFWRHKRKVSDIGIEDMSIPVGFKTPISQRLKRSFRFVSGSNDHNNNQDNTEKEPELVAADHYYITYAKLESGKMLSLTLANDPLELDDKVIKIDYDLADFNNEGKNLDSEFFKKLISEGRLPTIDYIEKQETHRLNLLQEAFIQITNIPKILVLGKAVFDKMNTLLDSATVSSHIKLEVIKVDDKEAVIINNDSAPLTPTLHYDEDLVILFLGAIATGFSSLIQKLKERSPVSGELILRYETDRRQREEFTVRTDELNSMLSSTDEGKMISTMLGLSDNQSSNAKTPSTYTSR